VDEDQIRAEQDTSDTAGEPVEEVLVEEVSIDGMCGVY
jgi:mycofactocin precursor